MHKRSITVSICRYWVGIPGLVPSSLGISIGAGSCLFYVRIDWPLVGVQQVCTVQGAESWCTEGVRNLVRIDGARAVYGRLQFDGVQQVYSRFRPDWAVAQQCTEVVEGRSSTPHPQLEGSWRTPIASVYILAYGTYEATAPYILRIYNIRTESEGTLLWPPA